MPWIWTLFCNLGLPFPAWFRNKVCAIGFCMHISVPTDEPKILAPNRKMKSICGSLCKLKNILALSLLSNRKFRDKIQREGKKKSVPLFELSLIESNYHFSLVLLHCQSNKEKKKKIGY